MFGQIIDLLVKQEDERRKILLLVLKTTFTLTLATKVYICIIGNFTTIQINDYEGIINFFLSGNVIICFTLFYIVWVVSYNFISAMLSFISLWLTTKTYKYLSLLLEITPEEFKSEMTKSKGLEKYYSLLTKLLNSTDVIEYENNIISSGVNFHKFYDYLLDIEDGNKTITTIHFSSIISLIIQFIVIYKWLGLTFLSHSFMLFFTTSLILFFLFISNFIAFNVSTLIDLKHRRLLKFLEKIEPHYQQNKLNRQIKNETSPPTTRSVR